MCDERTIWKSLLTWMIVSLTSHSVAAAELSIGDLLGKWCGTTTNYTFTHSELIVIPLQGQSLAHGRHLAIFKIEGRSDQIAVHWSDKPDDFTTFEFSTDKKQLIQVEQQEGDKGARRVFHRC